MPLQCSRLVVGTAIAVGLATAGIIGSAAAINANFERPRPALSIRRVADPQPETLRIDDHQRMRELFIDPTTGRPR